MRKLKENKGEGEPIKVNKTLKPVPEEHANIEVEKGEVVVTDSMISGFPELYTAAGKRHYAGGTPLELNDNSFIFSRDKSMRIKNPEILESFGKTPKKIGYDPAEIARQYDINKYRKVLVDPTSDKIQRETAELMIENYNNKLGKLALVQESMKGFEDGIPFIAMPYLENMGIDPSAFVTGAGSGEQMEPDTMREGGSFKIRIKNMPVAQKGKEVKGDPVIGDEFAVALAEKVASDDLEVQFSPFTGDAVSRQHAVPGKGAVHGREDWTDAEHFPDFRNRNAWYFEEHPDFNPRDSEQVRDFQKAYNERAVSMGLKPYFVEKPGSKYDIDGKFGEVTYSAPGLRKKEKAPEAPVEPPPPSIGGFPLEKPEIEFEEPIAEEDAPFWTQDLVKMIGAGADYARIRKYLPWQAGYQTVLADPTFFDPTRELAANSEQVNAANQVLGAFGDPQALNARMSEVQGRGFENVANILGKYNNLNVGVANQVEQFNTQIMNTDSLTRANRATDLYDKNVIANQMFDNARAMARQQIRQSFIDAWTNRGKTQALNSINKQYRVDPRTGFVEFKGVPGRFAPSVAKSLENEFDDLMQNPMLRQNPDIAYKIALKNMGIATEDEVDTRYLRMQPY